MDLFYENDEFEFEHNKEQYRCYVRVDAIYSHEEPVYYFRDGSGYPGSTDIDIKSFNIKDMQQYNYDIDQWCCIGITDELERAVLDKLKKLDSDEWSYTDTCEESEPEPEPPYDWVVRDKEPL